MTLELENGVNGSERNSNDTNTTGSFVQLLKERPLFIIIPILLTVITNLVIFFIRKRLNKPQNLQTMAQSSFCISEHCVRCNKYEDTKERSIELLEDYKKELMTRQPSSRSRSVGIGTNNKNTVREIDTSGIRRVIDAVVAEPTYNQRRKQNPNVVNIDGLFTRPFWNDNRFNEVQEILERNYQTVLSEFFALPIKTRWLENTTPHGTWRVFHLINQGLVQEENCALVPETMKLLLSLPGLMKHSLFGNVSFSVVDAGTWITPHYGPCNCRIRCHLGLITSPEYHLIVDGVRRRSWRNGRCLFFDDSFLHEVRYLDEHNVEQVEEKKDDNEVKSTVTAGNKKPAASLGNVVAKRQKSREEDFSDRMSRAVLIVDLWHPDLTDEEIDALNYLFPGSESSYSEWRSEKKPAGNT